MYFFLTRDWISKFIETWSQNNLISKSINHKVDFYNSTFQFSVDNKDIPAIVVPHPMEKKRI